MVSYNSYNYKINLNNDIKKPNTNNDIIASFNNELLYKNAEIPPIYYENRNFNFIKKNKRMPTPMPTSISTPIYNINTILNDQCGAILFDKSGQYVLIIKQRLSNKWGLPKGHMNKRELLNDDKLECVKREINEETGINLNKIKYFMYESEYINNRLFYIFHLHKYKEKINLNPFDLNEICDYTWISIIDLHTFLKNNQCNKTLRDMENSTIIKYKLWKSM